MTPVCHCCVILFITVWWYNSRPAARLVTRCSLYCLSTCNEQLWTCSTNYWEDGMEDEYGFCRSSEGSYCCGENILTDNHVLMLAYHGHFHNFLSVVVLTMFNIYYFCSALTQIFFVRNWKGRIVKSLIRFVCISRDEYLYFLATSVVLSRPNVFVSHACMKVALQYILFRECSFPVVP